VLSIKPIRRRILVTLCRSVLSYARVLLVSKCPVPLASSPESRRKSGPDPLTLDPNLPSRTESTSPVKFQQVPRVPRPGPEKFVTISRPLLRKRVIGSLEHWNRTEWGRRKFAEEIANSISRREFTDFPGLRTSDQETANSVPPSRDFGETGMKFAVFSILGVEHRSLETPGFLGMTACTPVPTRSLPSL
jgi:hypothetical protein